MSIKATIQYKENNQEIIDKKITSLDEMISTL